MEDRRTHYNPIYALPTRTIYQPDYQHLTHTPVVIPTRQVTMSNGYDAEYKLTNTGYQTQSTQEHITGRTTFENQNVKNSNKFSSMYDSLVDECSCKFCQCVQFDFKQCQTRLHSQPVEYRLDPNQSGQISNKATENQFINDLFDPTDTFRTNFITPEPAIAYSTVDFCNEVESSSSSEKNAHNRYQNYDQVEQGIDLTQENFENYDKKPKSHSVALLDDWAITITFGPEPRIRYAILNLADLSHINHSTVEDSPYLRQLERTPIYANSTSIQIAGNIIPKYCYCIQPMIYIQNEIIQINMLVSRDFDHTITLGRDFASWFQLGISLPDRRVFFSTISERLDIKAAEAKRSSRKPKSRKTKNKSSEKSAKLPRNMEIRTRGRYNIPDLE